MEAAGKEIGGGNSVARTLLGGLLIRSHPTTLLASRAASCENRRMDLSNFQRMDPHLLVGLVNTELRNHCESLDDLVKTHNLDPQLLEERLAAADYVYRPEQNQFR